MRPVCGNCRHWQWSDSWLATRSGRPLVRTGLCRAESGHYAGLDRWETTPACGEWEPAEEAAPSRSD